MCLFGMGAGWKYVGELAKLSAIGGSRISE